MNRRSFFKKSAGLAALALAAPLTSETFLTTAAALEKALTPALDIYPLISVSHVGWKTTSTSVVLNENWLANINLTNYAAQCGRSAAETVDKIILDCISKKSRKEKGIF